VVSLFFLSPSFFPRLISAVATQLSAPPSCLRYYRDVAHWRPTKLCTMFGCLCATTLYIHFRRLLPPDRILPSAIFTLRPSLAFSYIVSYCTYVGVTARHSSSGHQSNFAAWYKEWNKLPNFRRGRHLYLAGRPSRWASAVILVTIVVLFVCHNCSYCDFVTTV